MDAHKSTKQYCNLTSTILIIEMKSVNSSKLVQIGYIKLTGVNVKKKN
jgi:hypothetical protein